MKKIIISLLFAGSLVSMTAEAHDRDITVDITNLTNAIYFTPLLVASHDANSHLFRAGHPASVSLQAMAEGGDTSGLIGDLEASGANYVDNPAGGLLAPGNTATAEMKMKKSNKYLSIVAMLLPTNDGFVGLGAVKIPKKKGTYSYYVNGYDAGTEGNDEIINGGGAPNVPGIPAAPDGEGGSLGGTGASGVTGLDHNQTVHIHRGIVGDTVIDGGTSDLDSAVHQWLNPVAKVVVTVK